MISIRQLNSNDSDVFVTLVKNRPQTFMGYNDDAFQQSVIVHIPSWLSDPLCFCIGLFKDDEIIGAMVAIESPHSPSWTWAYWVGQSGAVGVSLNEILQDREETIQTLRDVDKFLFDEMEKKRGLTRFYIALRDIPSSTALRSSRSSDRLLTFMKKFNLSTSRYEVYDDAFIPADSMPKYEYQKQIIGNRAWPIDLAIKLCVLIK
jgi:hypothetical protein